MTDTTTNKPFLRALAGESLTPPPVWLMRQAGRYLPEYRALRQTAPNFLDFCYTPDKAVEVTLQPLRRYHFDAAILFSDILVIPDALGQKVEFKTGEGPVLEPVRSLEDLEKLSADRLHVHLAAVYETVGRLSKEIPATTALIGFCGAPWTVATYMVEGRGGSDYGITKDWAYRAPEEFARLMDLLVDATAAYLNAQIKAGAECVQIFDSWAGVLSEPQFHKWVIEPTIRIIEKIRADHPDIPVIGFPKGAGAAYIDYVRETKVDGVGLDTTVPLTWAAENLQHHCTVQGNLENHLLVTGGAALDAEIRRILDVLGRGPFIFNLGHGILPPTPPENVARLLDVVRGKA